MKTTATDPNPPPARDVELMEDLLSDQERGLESRERSIARLRLLWEKRRFLTRVTVWGLLVSTLIAWLIPNRYEATARLMPPDSRSGAGMAILGALTGGAGGGVGGELGGLGGLASDLLGTKQTGALFVGVLQSRTVQDRLIERFDLKKLYWDRKIEDARKDLAKHTDITEERKSGIISITVTDKDPQRAPAMAQVYVGELNRLLALLNTSAAHRERVFLEGRLQEVNRDLEAASKEFSQFSSKNTAIDIKEQGKAMVAAAAILQGQLIAAQSELSGLEQIYTENNVRVRALRARIAELRQQLDKFGGKDLTGNSDGTEEAPLYPSIRKLPLLGVRYAELYRRTKIEETVFELLTREYELAKVQEAKEIPSVKVLDQPVVPEKKSFPPRLLLSLTGTLLAFSLGMVWVLGTTAWETTDQSDPRKVFAGDVLSNVREDFSKISSNGTRFNPLKKAIGILMPDSWTSQKNGESAEPQEPTGRGSDLMFPDKENKKDDG